MPANVPLVGQRVMTRFGWGTVTERECDRVVAKLDTPFAGGKTISGGEGEIIDVLPYAVIRIVNAGVAGTLGNVTFLSVHDACNVYHATSPANETRFFLDFTTGTFEQNRPLGSLFTSRYLRLEPWVDRWGVISGRPDIRVRPGASIRTHITRVRDRTHSTSGGFSLAVVLDRRSRKIVWSAFLCERGWQEMSTTLPKKKPALT